MNRKPVDLFYGFILLLLSIPVLLPVIGYILMFEKYSPIFVQERVGLNQKPFNLYKVTTMQNGLVTPLGSVLRKFRLDELPNAINILKGDMNLVGPRPETVENHLKLCRKLKAWPLRTAVKPGLTGFAQVTQGHINPGLDDSGEKLNRDLFYIEKACWLFDAWIIFKTISVVLTGAGK
jgi:lipopolysaccharide/colanic/teichoic acid biosynthesis glycosyltransferase